jgi:hypothetical protein
VSSTGFMLLNTWVLASFGIRRSFITATAVFIMGSAVSATSQSLGSAWRGDIAGLAAVRVVDVAQRASPGFPRLFFLDRLRLRRTGAVDTAAPETTNAGKNLEKPGRAQPDRSNFIDLLKAGLTSFA